MSSEASNSNKKIQPGVARVGKYLMLDVLGEGAFGKVRLAVDESTGKEYAMKIMQKSHITANELTLQVRREIAVMKAMQHPNIVNLHEVLTSSKNIYMVMDLVTGGELFDAVAAEGKLSESQTRSYFQQLVDGVEYCHRRRVYHRDLKPENLLLSGDKQILKITDFGLSSIKSQNAASELLHTIMGSPHYIAPEIITSAAEGYDGAKVDVWASGVILFGMLAGYLPFDEPDTRTLYKAIVQNPVVYPPHFSYDVIKLLRAMLEKNPARRPSMEQVKAFTWFKVNYEPVTLAPEANPKPNQSGQKKKSRNRLRRTGERSSRTKKKDKAQTSDTAGAKESSLSINILKGRGRRKRESSEGNAQEPPFHSALFQGSGSSHDEQTEHTIYETVNDIPIPTSPGESLVQIDPSAPVITEIETPKGNLGLASDNFSEQPEEECNQHNYISSHSNNKNTFEKHDAMPISVKPENESHDDTDNRLLNNEKAQIENSELEPDVTKSDAAKADESSEPIIPTLVIPSQESSTSPSNTSTTNLEHKDKSSNKESGSPYLLAEKQSVQNDKVTTLEHSVKYASTSMEAVHSMDMTEFIPKKEIESLNHSEEHQNPTTETNEENKTLESDPHIAQISSQHEHNSEVISETYQQAEQDASPLSFDSKMIFQENKEEKKNRIVSGHDIFSTFQSPISETCEPGQARCKDEMNQDKTSVTLSHPTSTNCVTRAVSGSIFKPIAKTLAPLALNPPAVQTKSSFIPSAFNPELEDGIEGASECGIDATEAFADADHVLSPTEFGDIRVRRRKSNQDILSQAVRKQSGEVIEKSKQMSIFTPLDASFVHKLRPSNGTEAAD